MGPVATASILPRRASVTASSSAAAAARLVSTVASPNEQSGYFPMMTYSAVVGRAFDLSAARITSGPMPAQSPSVIPMLFKVAQLSELRNKDSQAGRERY